MSVLILDSSVIFDLERGLLIPAAFKLDATYAVPDLLLDGELGDDPLVAQMLGLGLKVIELEPQEVERAQGLAKKYHPRLSQIDTWALVSAARPTSNRLLTGDGSLREAARSEKVACSGVLWVLEQIRASRVASAFDLHNGLMRIKQHTRTRLPAPLVDAMMRQLETGHEKGVRARPGRNLGEGQRIPARNLRREAHVRRSGRGRWARDFVA